MAKLTSKERNKLAGKSFALPGRRYPIEDASHARNALARVSQHGSPSEKSEVRAKVHSRYPGIDQKSAKQPHPETNPGPYDTEAHHDTHTVSQAKPHQFQRPAANNAHGYGHGMHVRKGALRFSGHSGAHRVGSK